MTPKLPDSIEILGIPYQILWVEKNTAIADVVDDVCFSSDGDEEVSVTNQVVTAGYISFDDEKIVMDESMPFYSTRLTLLHEVLHGCLHPLGRDDEGLVSSLSYVLLQTFRNNPDVVKFLMEEKK